MLTIYESTKESSIYKWVHENIHDSRILNLGLASYGLVNFPFSNEVIVPYRIPEARDDYDYITVLLRDPYSGTHYDPERWKSFCKKSPNVSACFSRSPCVGFGQAATSK